MIGIWSPILPSSVKRDQEKTKVEEKMLVKKDLEEIFTGFEKRQDEKLKGLAERVDSKLTGLEERVDLKLRGLEERVVNQFHIVSEGLIGVYWLENFGGKKFFVGCISLKLRNAIHPDSPKNIPYICHYFNASKQIKAGLRGGIYSIVLKF